MYPVGHHSHSQHLYAVKQKAAHLYSLPSFLGGLEDESGKSCFIFSLMDWIPRTVAVWRLSESISDALLFPHLFQWPTLQNHGQLHILCLVTALQNCVCCVTAASLQRPVVSRCFRELTTQRPALPTIPFYHPSGAMCLEEIIDVIMAMQPWISLMWKASLSPFSFKAADTARFKRPLLGLS